jgi:Ras family
LHRTEPFEALVLAYNISSQESFLGIHKHQQHISTIPTMIVGIKGEATRREVTTQEGGQMAEMHGCRFAEIDVTSFADVEHMFHGMIRAIRASRALWVRDVTIGQEGQGQEGRASLMRNLKKKLSFRSLQ